MAEIILITILLKSQLIELWIGNLFPSLTDTFFHQVSLCWMDLSDAHFAFIFHTTSRFGTHYFKTVFSLDSKFFLFSPWSGLQWHGTRGWDSRFCLHTPPSLIPTLGLGSGGSVNRCSGLSLQPLGMWIYMSLTPSHPWCPAGVPFPLRPLVQREPCC